MPVEDDPWPDDVQPPVAQDLPDEVTGTIPRGPSVTTPDLDPEPHRDAAEDASDDQEETPNEPLPEFDPKVREEFTGLLYLGKLSDKFFWLGHEFVIRTITTDEILEVGLIAKKYADTLADVKAYQAALVAACVVTVDGRPLPSPLTVDPSDTALLNRFQYVIKNWYPSALNAVYEQYLLLEAKVERVLDAMGEAPG